MNGFYFLPKAPDGGHMATPVKDSWYEESSQHPANLKSEASYPVIAVCQVCCTRIRLAEKNQMEWVHVPEQPRVPGVPAEQGPAGTPGTT